jgi:hypothetical protein
MRPAWTQQAQRTLVYVANAFARVPTSFFLALAALHANYWITKIVHHVVLCVLQFLLIVNAPAPWVGVAKQYSSRTRELSFTKPSDWLFAYYRVYRFRGRVDVVVAHYKEDLGWLGAYLDKIDHLYLYCKDQESCQKGLPTDHRGATLLVQQLPNEGREANTYLHHIIHHYDDLAPRTVFTMASLNGNWMRKLSFLFSLTETGQPNKHCYSPEFFETVRHFQFDPKPTVATSLGDGYDNRAQGSVIQLAAQRPLGKWMHAYFARDLFEGHCRYGDGQHGAIFSATRDMIRRYPLRLYDDLLRCNQGADSMEAGYFMERVWRFMFLHDKIGSNNDD